MQFNHHFVIRAKLKLCRLSTPRPVRLSFANLISGNQVKLPNIILGPFLREPIFDPIDSFPYLTWENEARHMIEGNGCENNVAFSTTSCLSNKSNRGSSPGCVIF